MKPRSTLPLLLAAAALAWPSRPDAAAETYRYGYDAAGRLVEVRSDSHVIGYGYDAAGTVVSREGGPNEQVFIDGFEGDAP